MIIAQATDFDFAFVCAHSYASERFGREHAAAPLLLAAGAPAATIDPAIYTAPSLRCANSVHPRIERRHSPKSHG